MNSLDWEFEVEEVVVVPSPLAVPVVVSEEEEGELTGAACVIISSCIVSCNGSGLDCGSFLSWVGGEELDPR